MFPYFPYPETSFNMKIEKKIISFTIQNIDKHEEKDEKTKHRYSKYSVLTHQLNPLLKLALLELSTTYSNW